ncbi:sporulation integral membrane protein YtvI [Clostridium sp. MSJ-4]|uniref:Sporulation integral membrane protein YtvI n=1 Tax=Clostridium simiarum TaxID=2841506 RepID=A0ABS6F2C1_9CLOT|nr:sporulation integral membrane protein YtvI [Clostridium simiarum]MBU5592398.1 sporulation integral membrane protein YtvI [Clostridium simiarum]
MESFQEKINKLLLFFVIYTISFMVFFKTLPYTLPFVLALICAYLLRRPTRYLINKFKMKASLASLLTTLIFFTAIISIFSLTISSIINEIIGLTKLIQNYINTNYYNILNIFSKLQDNFNNIDPYIIEQAKNYLLSSISGILNSTVNIGSSLVGYFINILSSIPYIGMVIVFTLLSTYFFTKRISLRDIPLLTSAINNKNSYKILEIFNHAKKMLLSYIASYGFVILISFAITLAGFLILGVNYALILSILCALFDLLPVLGMPLIYIPLIVYNLFIHNYFIAIGLTILYVAVFITRQIVEPKIMSSSLGLDPVAVLAAIFIGLKAKGISGMVFCMFLVVFYNIFKKTEII